MQIDRNNYEAYLLDMIEGELSPEEENELMQFLSRNPDLETCHDLSDITVPLPGIEFPAKEDIRKGALSGEITRGNYEQFCIARLEGDLSITAEKALDNFLSENPDCLPSARLYDMLVLKADKRIHFPGNHLLKNDSPFVFPWVLRKRFVQVAVSIAASVVLIFAASVFIRDINRSEQTLTIPKIKNTALTVGTLNSLDKPGMPGSDLSRVQTSEINTGSILSAPLLNEEVANILMDVENEKIPDNDFIDREPVLQPLSAKLLTNIETTSSRSHINALQLTGLYRPPSNRITKQKHVRENIIYGITGFFAGFIDSPPENNGISIWDLADAGVRGINGVTGSEMQIEREYNKEGDIVSMAFNSRIIEFKRSTYSFKD